MSVGSAILDIVGGLFLVVTGALLVVFYFAFRSLADNVFISFLLLLFLIGLGIGAIVAGSRRVYRTFSKLLRGL